VSPDSRDAAQPCRIIDFNWRHSPKWRLPTWANTGASDKTDSASSAATVLTPARATLFCSLDAATVRRQYFMLRGYLSGAHLMLGYGTARARRRRTEAPPSSNSAQNAWRPLLVEPHPQPSSGAAACVTVTLKSH
jgi:hypothetical protein